jgi:hypothetical protein
VLPRVVTHGEIPGAQREFVDPNVGDELGQQPPRLVEAGEVCDERCIWAGDKSSQRPQERSGPLPAARGHDSAGMQMLDDPGERSSGLQHVVNRAEHRGVRDSPGGHLFGGCPEEPDVSTRPRRRSNTKARRTIGRQTGRRLSGSSADAE